MKLLVRGDARRIPLADGSVHCCVTSPPYWGLRCYGIDGQLGLERTPEEYVAEMVAVFREVRRVLREDGTLWLNLGDSYASSGGEREYGSSDNGTGRGPGTRRHDVPASGLKPKDLVGIPWRVAFALQAGGWYLRSDIIWSKPAPMPESVRDRPTKSHEYLFLLSKRPSYYYDGDAIKERTTHAGKTVKTNGAQGMDDFGDGMRTRAGFARGITVGATRNKRTVWTVNTHAYKGAHFATFPPKLIEPCILAGTSERGCCPECGAAWERVVEVERVKHPKQPGRGKGQRLEVQTGGVATSGFVTGLVPRTTTTGWRPTCDHDAEPVPCTVLDPFVGSGTTVMVANEHGRRGVGVDLNPNYLREQAARRTADVQRRFA